MFMYLFMYLLVYNEEKLGEKECNFYIVCVYVGVRERERDRQNIYFEYKVQFLY